jgi:hypothetical protein
MGYYYGRGSLEKLKTLHPDLQAICLDLIKIIDVTIVWGYRGEVEQNIAWETRQSDKKFPHSKHNRLPSRGVDVAPYNAKIKGVDWNDTDKFYYMDGIIKGIAQARGIRIRGGWDWDGDNDFTDQNLNDLAHFELED